MASFSALNAIRLDQAKSLEALAAARTGLEAALREAGFPPDDVETLFEAYERLWDPRFGAGADKWKGNDDSRRIFDAALRRGVPQAAMTAYTSALKVERGLEEQAFAVEGQVFAEGGHAGLRAADEEARRVLGLRDDVVRIARQINPEVDLKVVYAATEAETDGPGRYDPLRRIAVVALDPARIVPGLAGPERQVYESLWSSIEQLLTPKERRLLAERHKEVGPAERAAAAAGDFARWAAPGRERERGLEAFGPYKTITGFFERVRNAARGHGFQTAEDIFSRVREGKVAERTAPGIATTGLRLPLPGENRSGYEQAIAALGKMSDLELLGALRTQESEIDRVGSVRRGLLRALWRNNAVVTALSSSVAEGNREEHRQYRELTRMGAAMRRELERRRELGLGQAAERLDPGGGSPDGGRPLPTPELPPPLREQIARTIEGGLEGGSVVRFPAARGEWEVTRAPAEAGQPARDGATLRVAMVVAGGTSVEIGQAASPAAAAALIDVFDEAGGPVSLAAARLARRANDLGPAGDADITAIRAAGLVDPRLDALINARDVHCLVYPLTTGDVLFADGQGRWRAASADAFLAAAARDPALQAGVDVVSAAREEAQASAPRRRDAGARREGADPAADGGASRMADDRGPRPGPDLPGERFAGPDRPDPVTGRPDSRPDDGRVYLSVPPTQEEDARRAGAEFDRAVGRFFVAAADTAAVSRTAQWAAAGAESQRAAEVTAMAHGDRPAPQGAEQVASTGRAFANADSVEQTAAVAQHSGAQQPVPSAPAPAAAAAAAYSAGRAPELAAADGSLVVDPGLPASQRKDLMRHLNDDKLTETLRATRAASQALESKRVLAVRGEGDPLTVGERQRGLGLKTAVRELLREVEARGLTIEQTAHGRGAQQRGRDAERRQGRRGASPGDGLSA